MFNMHMLPCAAVVAVVLHMASVLPSAWGAEDLDAAFYANPAEWGGICSSGSMQSPINLPARYHELPAVPADLVTTVRMPSVAEPKILNQGHAIQVHQSNCLCYFLCLSAVARFGDTHAFNRAGRTGVPAHVSTSVSYGRTAR